MTQNKDTTQLSFFEQGRECCKGYYTSQAYAGLTRNITAELAIRMYLPPIEESLVQVAMPMPKDRQKWLAGFKKEQLEYLKSKE